MTALILLSVAADAFALGVCPHMNGNSENCPARHAGAVAPAAVSADAHCKHSVDDAMAAFDVPKADTSSNINRTSAPAKTGAHPQAISLPGDDCARCIMHSQKIHATSFRAAVPSGGSLEVAAAPEQVERIKTSSPGIAIFDPHDHGPPGKALARHVLLNVFRI